MSIVKEENLRLSLIKQIEEKTQIMINEMREIYKLSLQLESSALKVVTLCESARESSQMDEGLWDTIKGAGNVVGSGLKNIGSKIANAPTKWSSERDISKLQAQLNKLNMNIEKLGAERKLLQKQLGAATGKLQGAQKATDAASKQYAAAKTNVGKQYKKFKDEDGGLLGSLGRGAKEVRDVMFGTPKAKPATPVTPPVPPVTPPVPPAAPKAEAPAPEAAPETPPEPAKTAPEASKRPAPAPIPDVHPFETPEASEPAPEAKPVADYGKTKKTSFSKTVKPKKAKVNPKAKTDL